MKTVITAMLMSINAESDVSLDESEVIYQRQKIPEGAQGGEAVVVSIPEASEGAEGGGMLVVTKSSKSSKKWWRRKLPKLFDLFTRKKKEKRADQQSMLDSLLEGMTNEKIQELVIEVLKDRKYKQEIVPIDIWDFGGQKDYYMTHQLFITSRGIFVLMFNGSLGIHEHMTDLSFLPGHHGIPTTAGNLRIICTVKVARIF